MLVSLTVEFVCSTELTVALSTCLKNNKLRAISGLSEYLQHMHTVTLPLGTVKVRCCACDILSNNVPIIEAISVHLAPSVAKVAVQAYARQNCM